MPSAPRDQGFIVSPRLDRMIHADFAENHAPDVIAYFSKPDGSLLNAGDRLVNKPYAEFLRRLAAQGPSALYSGSTAARIIARTHAGAARRHDDHGRPRQLPADQARAGVRAVPRLHPVRAAAADAAASGWSS